MEAEYWCKRCWDIMPFIMLSGKKNITFTPNPTHDIESLLVCAFVGILVDPSLALCLAGNV